MNTTTASTTTGGINPTPASERNYLFVSRSMDFLLLGGISLLLWIPFYFLTGRSAAIGSLGLALPAVAITLGYWVNFPHFMASYKLAYTQGRAFIRANWLQLVLVPIAMLLLLALAYAYWGRTIGDSRAVLVINNFFADVGLKTRIGSYPNLGMELLGYFVLFMYFTVGWHYSKQTFGCMMVYAKFDQYPLAGLERNLIRYALLSTWWLTWLYSNCSPGTFPFYGLTIHRLNLPYLWFQVSYVVVAILFGALLIMFLLKYRAQKKLPSINFLVPMFALLTWHVPLFGQPQLFVVIALFHSLQYFPFVARVESTRYHKEHRPYPFARLAGFFLLMAAFGYLSFEYVPNRLDLETNAASQFGLGFFIIAIVAYINIHHYFIDNVLWRFKNKEVRELLFSR